MRPHKTRERRVQHTRLSEEATGRRGAADARERLDEDACHELERRGWDVRLARARPRWWTARRLDRDGGPWIVAARRPTGLLEYLDRRKGRQSDAESVR